MDAASVESMVAARQAIETGDKTRAMELLTAAIEADPYPWALAERAKLYAEQGNDEAASADVRAGLELDELNSDLKWIEQELRKPRAQRFRTPRPSTIK